MLKYKNITVEPLQYLGYAQAYKDNEKIGLVEVSIDYICYDCFMYTAHDKIYENAAHFIWTLYYSDNWQGILTIMEDEISVEERIEWQKQHT